MAQRLLRWELEPFVAAAGKLAKLQTILGGAEDSGVSGEGAAECGVAGELSVGEIRAESPVAARLLAWVLSMRNLGLIYAASRAAVAERDEASASDAGTEAEVEAAAPLTSSQAMANDLAAVVEPTDDEIRAALHLAM